MKTAGYAIYVFVMTVITMSYQQMEAALTNYTNRTFDSLPKMFFNISWPILFGILISIMVLVNSRNITKSKAVINLVFTILNIAVCLYLFYQFFIPLSMYTLLMVGILGTLCVYSFSQSRNSKQLNTDMDLDMPYDFQIFL